MYVRVWTATHRTLVYFKLVKIGLIYMICSRYRTNHELNWRDICIFRILIRSRDGSVGIAADYRLDDRGWIPDKGKRFFSTPQRPDGHWCPPSLLSNRYRGQSGRRVKLIIHLHLVPRSRMVELYLHSPTCLNGVALN
jgi:hypothetical protein